MVSRTRVASTVAGVLIGAYEGLGWRMTLESLLGSVLELGQLQSIAPLVVGAVIYGGLGYRYGVLGFGVAVVMLLIDANTPPGFTETAALVFSVWFVLPALLLVLGPPLPDPLQRWSLLRFR